MKDIRPTSSKVLSALFSILGEKIIDSKFLDLFAGTGHVGLEAIKHGASECVFVESVRNRAEAIKKFTGENLVLSLDFRRAVNWLIKRDMRFDIIFADPPYNLGFCEELMKLDNLSKLFNHDSLFILEHSIREKINPNENFIVIDNREYGETVLTFIKKVSLS